MDGYLDWTDFIKKELYREAWSILDESTTGSIEDLGVEL